MDSKTRRKLRRMGLIIHTHKDVSCALSFSRSLKNLELFDNSYTYMQKRFVKWYVTPIFGTGSPHLSSLSTSTITVDPSHLSAISNYEDLDDLT